MVVSDLQDDVREEIEDLHRFFVAWFNGTAQPEELDEVFVPRLDDAAHYVTPDGHRLGRDALIAMLRQAHGGNPDFRIQVRDVEVRRQLGEHLLVTYTEWQKGAKASRPSDNARVTTALLTGAKPFRWLHIHETWLPEAVRAQGPFDF